VFVLPVSRSVGPSVRMLVTTVNSGKTADWIEMPLGVVDRVGLNSIVLYGRACWRHLANTVGRLFAVAKSGRERWRHGLLL